MIPLVQRDTIHRLALEAQLHLMLQECTQEQADKFEELFGTDAKDFDDHILQSAYDVTYRTVLDNRKKHIHIEKPPTQVDDAPRRLSIEELNQGLDWAKKRKAEKPWYPDNDSPRVMMTCNGYIAMVEEILEARENAPH